MKKVLAAILALTLLGSIFAGCGSKSETSTPAAPAQSAENTDYASMTIEELKPLLTTMTAGKLTMVTSPDFAPYEFYALDADNNATLAGFDIALGRYIADFLGLELDIVPMDFDGTIMELTNKKADIGMAGYSPDPERAKVMDFSDIYYKGGQSFICHVDNAGNFLELADANKAEYQIGAQIGSIQAKLAQEHTPDADIVELSKVTDIIAEVRSGKLMGAFVETVVAESYARNYPEISVVLPVPYEAEGSVVGVCKGNAVLLAAVNLAIKAAIEDGSFAQFVADANELSTGAIFEGLLDANGNVG